MLFSLALILLFGLITSKISEKLGVPVMLGFIFTGALLGPFAANVLHADLLRISADLRMLALIIILLRAGLGISRDAIRQVGSVALKMSFLPCLVEGSVVTLVANRLLGLPLLEAAMLGFILAAVSPAVAVPSMLQLMEQGLGAVKKIPVIILGGASLDDVFAITILTSLLGAAAGATASPVYWQLLIIPLQITGGVIFGGLIGILLVKLFQSKYFNANYADQVILTLGAGIMVALLGEKSHVAGLLAVMTTGFVILEKAPEVATGLSERLKKIWLPAEIFLFTLIGAAVDFRLAGETGATGILIILMGLLGRSVGVWLATAGSGLNAKERLFCAIAYSPKATVQAAVGGLPLAAGIASGNLILAIAVLAIIITAPLGALAIRLSAPRLLATLSAPSLSPQFENDD